MTQILGGRKLNPLLTLADATELLELAVLDAAWLFSSQRTLKEIHSFCNNIVNNGYDAKGYDRDGFNLYGYKNKEYLNQDNVCLPLIEIKS